MTTEDVQLVQKSWEKIDFVKEVAAELFFARLFAVSPEIEPLFPADAGERQKKFTGFIGTTVRALNHVESLRPIARELGLRHPQIVGNDVLHSNVAAALLWTLHKSLRREFTPEVRGAWICAYDTLVQAMRDATSTPRAA